MLYNLLTDLVDPDNNPSGYGGLDLNNGGWTIIAILIAIIIVLIFIIIFLYLKVDKYKEESNTKNIKSENNSLSEKEQQTIAEFRKLTDEEKQIINDTIKTLNNSKKE